MSTSGTGKAAAIASAAALVGSSALAGGIETGGKLLLTRGISTIDGAAGGGISPWALIAGNETDRGIGGTAHATRVDMSDFSLDAWGFGVGFRDRFEVSYGRQEFNTEDAGSALGLGEGFTFAQDIYGAKLRIVGDAIYDQDRLMPQIAVGIFYKTAEHEDLLKALGAEEGSGYDGYISATKVVLSRGIILNGTLRVTDANQNGLLGFGGGDGYSIQPEASAAMMLSRRWVVGGEVRAKPDNLSFAEENDWYDVFSALAVTKNLTVTAAYADLGSIATFDDQRGLYLSLQGAF